MSEAWLVKRCSACRTYRPVSEFHRYRDGYQPWCKPCRKVYDAAYHQRVRPRRIQQKRTRHSSWVAWSRELKDHPCMDCGGSFHPAAMQWDHLPGLPKVDEIGELVKRGASRRTIMAEVAKCELVCANCHAVRTHQRRMGN